MYLLLRQVRDGDQSEQLKEYSQEEQAYNAALLIKDGYVEGDSIKGAGDELGAVMEDLTSSGHDLLESWERQMNQSQTSQPVEKGIAIFISHSARDVELAEAFVDFLRAGIGLSEREIRCTTVDGYRFPAGADTDEQLRKEVRTSNTFVGIITPASIKSAYVLFELGARWGAQLHLAPVLAKGASSSFLRGPLRNLNALEASAEPQLHQLLGEIAQQIGRPLANASVYSKALKKLLAAASATDNDAESSGSVSRVAFKLEPEVKQLLQLFFSANDSVSVRKAALTLKVSDNEARYYIDQMTDAGFLRWSGDYDSDDTSNFEITAEGRAYVMKNLRRP